MQYSRSQNNSPLMKIPPQRIEAEEALIASILLDNDNLVDILDFLTPQDFYKSSHQKIFESIVKLFNKREPIDLITLTDVLRADKTLEEVGGASFLANLIDTVPQAANVEYYGRIVHDKAVLRSLIESSASISKMCYQDVEVDEAIDYAQSSIFKISENKIKPSFSNISDLVRSSVEVLEERRANKTLVTGLSTGFSDLDKITSGFQASDFIILAGRPAMGKTAFALNIARNAAINHNIPVAVFSLEMSKEQLSMRLLCSEARLDASALKGGFFSQEDFARITDAASTLGDSPIFIDDSPEITPLEIRTKARRLKMEKGLGLIIIDYIQLIKNQSSQERRDLEISDISRSLKILAKELNIPVLALSQLNRKLEERTEKRPRLADLRESGALEQDADIVSFIYRDEVYNKDENNENKGTAEIIIAKHRNGPIGHVSLAFISEYTRFENLASQYEG
jgi:replicative DNA helicase